MVKATKKLIVVAALVCGIMALTLFGCDSAADEAAGNMADYSDEVSESTEPSTTDDVNGEMHELVYLPLSQLGIEDDLFGESALWGVMLADEPDIVVMHIGEGGLLNQEGERISLDDLEAGDVVKAEFGIIAMSYPGQVSVESAQLVRYGGEEAIEPYRGVLEAYEESALGADDTGEMGYAVVVESDDTTESAS